MVDTSGKNILNAINLGSPVKAIYNNGVQVWPPSTYSYYIKYAPGDVSGRFTINSVSHYLTTYMGYYTWSTGIIDNKAFYSVGWGPEITYFETNAISIGESALANLASITSLSLPNCEYIDYYGLYYCTGITSLSLPVCTSVSIGAFFGCTHLENAYLPVCGSLPDAVFRMCNRLTGISLPVCSYIGNTTFALCQSFSTITLNSTAVCVLQSSSAFSATQITSSTGSIYVPSSLVNAYKTANNWSYFKNRIYPINP